MSNKFTPADPVIETTVQRIETGGSFAKQLMAAYRTADIDNKQRIIDAFDDLFDGMVPMGSLNQKMNLFIHGFVLRLMTWSNI